MFSYFSHIKTAEAMFGGFYMLFSKSKLSDSLRQHMRVMDSIVIHRLYFNVSSLFIKVHLVLCIKMMQLIN